MKRTDIESVLKTLSNKSLTAGNMLQIPELVNNIIRISTVEAVDDVTNVILDDYGALAVDNIDDKQVALRIIIENIARFYPISRNLVIAIVKKIQLSDHFVLSGIDASGIVLKQINNIFNDLMGRNNTLTRFSNEYSIRLSDLEDKKKQYDELKNRLESVRKEKLILENELCNINHQIEKDNIEINKLKRQKEMLLVELTVLERNNEYKKISSEINELKDKINNAGSFGNVTVGSIIKFGSYPQNSMNRKEPIEWRVLAVENGKALLISKYALDCKKYEEKFVNTSWQKCSIRKWLNNNFFKGAFNDIEKNSILLSDVKADKNPGYGGTAQGNDTWDKVFLLSAKEAEVYFKSDNDRKCTPTNLVVINNVYNDDGHCWWWLRSLGYNSNNATSVDNDGSVSFFGDNVREDKVAVRPALWLNLKS